MSKKRELYPVIVVAAVFAVAAVIGAIHSLARGYSEIYTLIFVLLAGGYLLIGLLLWVVSNNKSEDKPNE